MKRPPVLYALFAGLLWQASPLFAAVSRLPAGLRTMPAAVAPAQNPSTDLVPAGKLRGPESYYDLRDHQLAMDGEAALAGFPEWVSTSTDNRPGRVTAFQRIAGREEWITSQTLSKPSGTAANARFGGAVAIAGKIAWIGAPGDGNGSVFQYRLGEDGQWALTGLRLQSSTPGAGPASREKFGGTLALGESWLAVGVTAAPYINQGSTQAVETGAVDIFETAQGKWQTRIYAASPQSYRSFGSIMAAGGDTLAMVSRGSNVLDTRVETHSRSPEGVWKRTAAIPPPDPLPDLFYGYSLALSEGVLMVGAPTQRNDVPGRIYVFEQNPDRTWRQSWKFAPPDGMPGVYLTVTAISGSRAALSFGREGGVSPEVEIWQRGADATWTRNATTAQNAAGDQPGGTGQTALSGRYLLLSGTGQDSRPVLYFYLHDSGSNVSPFFTGSPPEFGEEERPWRYQATARDDNSADTLSLSAAVIPPWLVWTPGPPGEGSLAGTPPEGAAGNYPVTLTVTDSSGAAATQSFTLKILPRGGLPAIRSVSPDQTVPDNGRLELTASLEDNGAASWQWYANGVPLPGENAPVLKIEHAQASDAGVYTVKASRAPAEVESPAMRVSVLQNPDRFGGDWPTMGASVSHSGRYPATLGRHTLLPAWSIAAAPDGSALNQTVTGGGRVFVSFSNYDRSAPVLRAFDLKSGDPAWSKAVPVSNAFSPPSYHRGVIYEQRSKAGTNASDIRAFDASDGTLKWTRNYQAQVAAPYAPAVTDDGIFTMGGEHGGLYRYSLAGVPQWSSPAPQRDQWTPLIHEGGLYSWTGGIFNKVSITDGLILWTATTPWVEWFPYTVQTVPAAEGRLAAVLDAKTLRIIDLHDKAVLAEAAGSFFGSPAIADGTVYAITPGAVRAFKAADGVELEGYRTLNEAGEEQTGVHQPVILDDYVLVSSLKETWVFDRESRVLKQRLPAGGPLTYTDGYLLIAGADGVLRAFAVNQPPSLTPPAAPLVWSEDVAGEYKIPVSDPDGDGLAFTLENKPAWLSLSVPVDGGLILSGTPQGTDTGSFTLRLVVSDNKSGESAVEVEVTVLEVNDAPVAARTLVEFFIDEDGVIPAVEARGLFDDEEDGAAGLTLSAERPPVASISDFDFDPATGRLLMTPAADYNGTVLIPVRATDSGGLTAETVLSVQIRPVNDAPRLTGLPEGGLKIVTDEDMGPMSLDLSPFITDPESPFSGLSLKVRESGPATLATAEITAAGELILTLKPDAFGEEILVVEITDNGNLTTELPVKLTVRPVNDPPTASNPAPVTAKEDAAPLSLPGRTLFSDVDNALESLTLTLSPAPEDAPFTAALLADGTVRVAFKPDASGAGAFTLRAADAEGLSSEATYQISVEPVPDAPTAPAELPSPVVAEDGAPVVMELAAFFKDADEGDILTFSITGNAHPELFSSAEIHSVTGALRLEWAPYVWGTARLTVRAADSAGLFVESSFTVTLPAPPAPGISLRGAVTLNRQTGLLEQTAIVTNTGPRAMAGFHLWLDCGEGAELYNGMSGAANPAAPQPSPAAWYVPWERPVAAGETVAVILELYSPRRTGTVTLHSAQVWNPAGTPQTIPVRAEGGLPFAVSRTLPLVGGILVEFPTEPRAIYRLEYSPDGVHWIASPLSLRAGGTAVQWLDRGPPSTGSHPFSESRRFYRAVKL